MKFIDIFKHKNWMTAKVRTMFTYIDMALMVFAGVFIIKIFAYPYLAEPSLVLATEGWAFVFAALFTGAAFILVHPIGLFIVSDRWSVEGD